MTPVLATAATIDTLADLLDRLGNIPLHRIRFRPAPGTATEEDLLELTSKNNRLYELVDGVLVEKPMAFRESVLALALGALLRAFVMPRNAGVISGADGTMRLFPGLVRIPDVAFASWDRFPDRRLPSARIPSLVPDLAAEVLSETNTPAEMDRKVREYFNAGVRLVWLIDPEARTVAVYTAADQFTVLSASDTLNGGDVLPGFTLSLQELFAELDRQGRK
jgi:Uma2 family endonuclease